MYNTNHIHALGSIEGNPDSCVLQMSPTVNFALFQIYARYCHFIVKVKLNKIYLVLKIFNTTDLSFILIILLIIRRLLKQNLVVENADILTVVHQLQWILKSSSRNARIFLESSWLSLDCNLWTCHVVTGWIITPYWLWASVNTYVSSASMVAPKWEAVLHTL